LRARKPKCVNRIDKVGLGHVGTETKLVQLFNQFNTVLSVITNCDSNFSF